MWHTRVDIFDSLKPLLKTELKNQEILSYSIIQHIAKSTP